ncbi:MAG: AMP-binding protein, partial [Anaerolineales bacterium]
MTTFLQQLKALHSQRPERVATYLQFSGREDVPITYDQILHGANTYASTLASAGVKPGEVVVLILQHGEDLIYAFWGTILHGAIPSIMPFLTEKLSPERYRADLTTLVSVTKPSAIITYPDFAAEIQTTLNGKDSTCSVITTDQLEQKTDLHF